jgi:hypothetical protein
MRQAPQGQYLSVLSNQKLKLYLIEKADLCDILKIVAF